MFLCESVKAIGAGALSQQPSQAMDDVAREVKILRTLSTSKTHHVQMIEAPL
jgi:hypothetical protein